MKRWILSILIIVLSFSNALAQGCAMCTSTAASLDSQSAKGLNFGILYLAAFPLIILGSIGLYWYKKQDR